MAAAPKILVIDDDKTFTAMAVSVLRPAGYHTVVAFDAMQGFMFSQREAPDLIVLDLSMPAGGGMQLLDKLRQSHKTQSVPVVIVTAMAARGLETEAKTRGAAGFVIKPIDPKGLVELVKQALEPGGA